MNIPPVPSFSTLLPLAAVSGDGGANMDAASQRFADLLSEAQKGSADQWADWQPGSEFFLQPPPDLPIADPPSSSAFVSDDPLQAMSATEGGPSSMNDGLSSENVSNTAENGPLNTVSVAPSMAEFQGPTDPQSVSDAGPAALPASQDAGQTPPLPDLSNSVQDSPQPVPDHAPDPEPEDRNTQPATPTPDPDQQDGQATLDDPPQPEVSPEPNSDFAEIDHGGHSLSGDPMPDAAPPQGAQPSSLSGSSNTAAASAPVLIQQGTPLSDHLIQVVQTAPDGPVTLTLSPDDMGTLSFEVQQSDGGISVHLTVERAETLDLLRRHADHLMDAFRQAGFAGASFTFAGGEGGQRDRPPPQTSAAWPDPIPASVQRYAIGLLDMRL